MFVELVDFRAAGMPFPTHIKEFKGSYLGAIESARRPNAPACAGRRVGARERPPARYWRTSTWRRPTSSRSSTTEACARDFGVSLRIARTYLGFGSFSDEDVFDEVPFSLHAELTSRINALRRAGIPNAEKACLVVTGRSKRLPARDAYRRNLRDALAG